ELNLVALAYLNVRLLVVAGQEAADRTDGAARTRVEDRLADDVAGDHAADRRQGDVSAVTALLFRTAVGHFGVQGIRRAVLQRHRVPRQMQLGIAALAGLYHFDHR